MKALNHTFIAGIKLYQRFISPLLGRNCRYYPSCSNYAFWLLEKQGLFKAIFKICLRILRCNPLFIGGIEYPLIAIPSLKSTAPKLARPKMIKAYFWLVPHKNKFYLIKSIS